MSRSRRNTQIGTVVDKVERVTRSRTAALRREEQDDEDAQSHLSSTDSTGNADEPEFADSDNRTTGNQAASSIVSVVASVISSVGQNLRAVFGGETYPDNTGTNSSGTRRLSTLAQRDLIDNDTIASSSAARRQSNSTMGNETADSTIANSGTALGSYRTARMSTGGGRVRRVNAGVAAAVISDMPVRRNVRSGPVRRTARALSSANARAQANNRAAENEVVVDLTNEPIFRGQNRSDDDSDMDELPPLDVGSAVDSPLAPLRGDRRSLSRNGARNESVIVVNDVPANDDDIVYLGTEAPEWKRPRYSPGPNQANASTTSSNESPAWTKVELQSQCPICFDDFRKIKNGIRRNIVSTNCGHLFCSRCILEAIKQQQECPNCRKKITAKGLRVIFM